MDICAANVVEGSDVTMTQESSIEHITSTILSQDSDTAIRVVKREIKSINELSAAVHAFLGKRSVRGIQGMEEVALKRLNALATPQGADVWFCIIAAYGRLGKLDSVSRCFKIARKNAAWKGDGGDVKHTTQYLHALHSNIKQAFVRARQLMNDGTIFDVSTFNVLLKSCMRQGDTRRAKLVLSWMSEARICPDEVSYSTLIKIFSYGKNFDGVLYVMELMEINGFTPTDEVLTNLLVACGTACQHDAALMIWRNIKRAKGTEPISVSLYEAMMVSCNHSSQGDMTLELLHEMKSADITPSVKSYNLALSGCRARPGKRAKPVDLINAMNIYSEMKSKGLTLDQFTYGQLMEICAEAGQGPIAAWLNKAMMNERVQGNVIIYTSLMKAMIRSQMIDESMVIFKKMVWGPAREKPTGATFRTLAKELREQGYLKEALHVYMSMRKADFAPNNIEFQKLIAAASEKAFAQGDPVLQQSVADLCKITSLSELDLHGTSRYEARAAVLCVLGLISNEYRMTRRDPGPLTIIVGRGGHSHGREPVLPSVVKNMLTDELRIKIPEDGEYGSIYCEELQPESRREGRITIPSDALKMWLTSRNKQ